MKILYFALTFFPENSGYANAFFNFISALKNEYNISIDVVTPTPLNQSDEVEFRNIAVHRINNITMLFKKLVNSSQKKKISTDSSQSVKICMSPIIYFQAFTKIANIILWFCNDVYIYTQIKKIYRSYDFNFIFIETFDFSIATYLLSRKFPGILLIRVHATNETEYAFFFPGIVNIIKKRFIKKAARRIRYLLSTNSYHIDFIKKHYLDDNLFSILNKTFFVLPNTLDEEVLNCIPKHPAEMNNNDKLRIFTLGRMDHGGLLQKGFQDLIAAFSMIDKKLLDKINVTIVGKGPYRKILVDYANNKNLKFINFIAEMDHKSTLEQLTLSDIVILPSRIEGLSMFALESLATKNAVVFSDVGGLVDLVEDNGFLFKNQDIEDLASKIEKILTLSKKEIDKMKQKSFQIYCKKFSSSVVRDKFLNILKIIST